MGEAKDRAAEIEAMKKAQAEAAERQKQMEAEFQKMISTPITDEEARKKLADIDIQMAQLRCIRLRKVAELNEIDNQIQVATLDRNIVIRRTLNPKAVAPKMGEPTGGGSEAK